MFRCPTLRLVPLIVLAFCLGAGSASAAAQKPLDLGAGDKADDVIRRVLLAGANVPTDVFTLRQELLKHGTLKTHIVANGGHEHPTPRGVMFMCFETYSGRGFGGKDAAEDELFLGFFIGREGEALAVRPGFVELIAWDRTKRLYNFWELIDGRWHYRGDSRDVLDDVAEINVAAAVPKFGQRLRCSGCHTLGGPIMKEMQPPHNDWWTVKGKLQIKPWRLEEGKDESNPKHLAAQLFQNASDAANLSRQVKSGIDRLLSGDAWQKGRSLKEQLRSLFGTMEMNLVTDRRPFKERASKGEAIEVPLDFYVDARLAGHKQGIAVEFERYTKALAAVGSRFPPGAKAATTETRHAFLVPARSYIDNRVLDALVVRALLDEELIADVLAVDFTTPVYSRARAALIRYVPEKAKDVRELREQLIKALEQAPAADQAAKELLANLKDPQRTAAYHRKAVASYLEACRKAAQDVNAVTDWLKVASQRRVEMVAAETARHPRGNILEAGFRVVFPADRLESRPGRLRLDPATGACQPIPGAKEPTSGGVYPRRPALSAGINPAARRLSLSPRRTE
ncbi:MAG TPA: hypothetical protein VEL76_14015 [Gemmataceae bacterium]|nr:hypothetical protein [Gemmataceae bacterium]